MVGQGGLDRHTHIHLNLSAASIGDASFVAHVLEALEDSGVVPEILVFEITETALVSNMAVAATDSRQAAGDGCQIALDDFGAGLSSFNYLRQFPVDIVKIDGSFIHNMTTNAVDRYIVKSIHQIAQELGAQTVAEFVEDQATFELVSSMGITFAQGYSIHRPEPLDADHCRSRNPGRSVMPACHYLLGKVKIASVLYGWLPRWIV